MALWDVQRDVRTALAAAAALLLAARYAKRRG
jgi:hypothetical protein